MTKMEALKASILHWQDNVEKAIQHEEIHHNWHHCMLCVKYCQLAKFNCQRCPVSYHTGIPQCRNSPWSNINMVCKINRGVPDGPLGYGWKDVQKACWEEYLFLLNIWYAEGGKSNEL